MIVNFPKFPPLEKMHQLDFGQCLFWVSHREIEVFYEGSSGWQRARPVPNLWVTVVMTGAGGKWWWRRWWRSFFKACICVSSYSTPYFIFSVFLSFPGLCPFPSPTSSWNVSLSPHPLPLFHSFPTINLWLSKPVVSSVDLTPGWKRDERLVLFHHWGARVNR